MKLLVLGAVLVFAGGSAPAPKLMLPYDLAAKGNVVYVADGLRHQILRLDLKSRRLAVVAGTGRPGASGDGAAAVRARLTEPTEVVVDRDANLYFSDIHEGRVRRVDARGVITTVARVRAAAGLAVDPSGRYLAIASIEDGMVYRLELETGKLGQFVPAKDAHDVTYAPTGDLLVCDANGVERVDVATGAVETFFARPACKTAPGPGGTFFVMTGDSRGGKVMQVDAGGRVLRTIGTGRLSKHIDRVAIGRVGFLPTDVEVVGGALLISQAQPVPAIRRLAPGSRTLTTLVR